MRRARRPRAKSHFRQICSLGRNFGQAARLLGDRLPPVGRTAENVSRQRLVRGYGNSASHTAAVTMVEAVPNKTELAATRFATPYMFAKT